jgi:hypothetical protein
MHVIVAVLIFFQVGAFFGDPAVEGRETTAAMMEIDLSVSAPPGGSVVAHLIDPGGLQHTVALREREPGLYGGLVEVRRADLIVVFEAVDQGGAQSAPHRLTDIGLDRALLGALSVAPTTTAPEVSASTRNWGWLALALGAASLALIALWALPERTVSRPEDPGESLAGTADADDAGEGDLDEER